MQEILWQLYNNGEVSKRKIFERVPMLERALDNGRPDARTLPSPRLIHSHLTYEVIPKGEMQVYLHCTKSKGRGSFILRIIESAWFSWWL